VALRQSLAETEAVCRAEVEAADRALESARQEAAEVRDRLDFSGQFVAACLRWWAASRSKRDSPVVRGVSLDKDYWWKRVEETAHRRWPKYQWQPDELLAAAREVAESIDLARWRRVVNSEFGLILPVG